LKRTCRAKVERGIRSAAILALANFVTLHGLPRRGAAALAGIEANLRPDDIMGGERAQPRRERKNFPP
jgi:hypothetical protein